MLNMRVGFPWTLLLVLILSIAGSILLSPSANAEDKPPFADIHIHFNWDQKEVISTEQIIAKLKRQNIAVTIVTSTPSSLALELYAADKQIVVPFFSPYITPASRQNWYLDKNVLLEAEDGLKNKRYFGIGELHLWSGMKPKRDNPILQGLLDLAEKYNVPFLIHTEASDHRFFLPLCLARPKIRFLWAHAGGTLSALEVGNVLQHCANVWVELSARDPWRYHSLVDDHNRLLPGWLELFQQYSNRVMTGTDPVWSVRKGQRWDEADEGWDHYEALVAFHRRWLKQLPPQIEEKIRLTNAQRFLSISP